MGYTIGEVVEGRVTGITKFGAFISLGDGKSGLVHISEIANSYVKEVREHLTEGQTVTVKILSVDENGRINLSIKKAAIPAAPAPREVQMPQKTNDEIFEDKLKSFMTTSNNRMADLKHQGDRKSGQRRPRTK